MIKRGTNIQSSTTRKPKECDNDVGQNFGAREEKVSKKLVCWTIMKKVIGSNFALFHR